ncbi:efflux RND transporter periplasmic adaptor subunit [Qipengyuania sp. DY56-A-20]|uniref:Efflux RND transporter periplasmic adaptor subunit n=1 Tax=Qipengyuania benthica TaxID=3067651 RepID=A0ABT9H726_9SPHN|nr:efflux RND transporter periplasmic adaptor subunit [Qipengyuania sp. DY56-A-20]MDP4539119.1 efflux RND transporter periplasmic adaptor subunit [Qipengyuania sp. DY56-A-20]
MRCAPLTASLLLLLTACGGGAEEPSEEEAAAAEQAQAISVRVARVEQGTIQAWVYAQGTARAGEREFLSFESAGRVAYVDPRLDEGDRVRRGQVIAYQQQARAEASVANARATLANARSEVTVAQANQRQAAASLELARETFERYRQLLALNSASEQEFDEAEARLAEARAAKQKADAQLAAVRANVDAAQAGVDEAQVAVSESRIVSPINGVIARLNIEQGQYFSPQAIQTGSESGALSTVPVVIINPSRFEITVQLPAFERNAVEIGSEVLIEAGDQMAATARATDSRPGIGAGRAPGLNVSDYAVRGQVVAISPSLDPERRSFQVTIRSNSGSVRLQDGEFVTTWIEGREAENTAIVPYDAIRFEDNQAFVFVYDPQTRTARRTAVELGLQGIEGVAIAAGVDAGTPIVTSGVERLSDGDRVRRIGASARQSASGASKAR